MIQDRTFFLTGCASGIGQHLANQILERGGRVYATDVNIDALKKHAEEKNWPQDRSRCAALDVRSAEAWAQVFSEAIHDFGHFDVVMNIAGILKSDWIENMPVSDTELQVDVNVKGVIYGTQEAARHMIPRKAGHIVNIASMASLAPIPGLAVYAGTKYAVRGFSVSCAGELRRHGIAVTAVCPDGVQTPLIDLPPDKDAADIIFSGSRLLTVEDVGELILNKVLVKKPLVAALPFSRAIQARIGDLFPGLGFGMLASLTKKGKQSRSRYQQMREQH